MGNWAFPADCRYTKTDEWVRLEGSEALVGISDYAQNQLSDLVYIELPKPGTSLGAGQVFGVVESVKAAAEVNLPISGEVIAINTDLESSPETVNSDPFGSGWLIRIRPTNPSDIDNLMDSVAYTAYCQERMS
jgi:glycine cleavage system H protein